MPENTDSESQTPESQDSTPNSEEKQPDSAAAPPAKDAEQDASPMGLDWRIIAIVALAAILILAAYINRKYCSKPKSSGSDGGQSQQAGNGEARPRYLKEIYANSLRSKEMEAAQFLYFLGKQSVFILAKPARPVTGEKNGNLAGLEPNIIFDISKRAEGIEPVMFHRRRVYLPDGNAPMLFVRQIPTLGTPQAKDVALVIKTADEIGEGVIADAANVVGVVANNAVRAYPLKFLNRHEVINDTLGDTPMVLSWSLYSLAGQAMTRTPLEEGGEPMVFGAVAVVYQSVGVLFDVKTESLWWPMRGTCIAGELTGKRQTMLKTFLTTWKTWKALYPKTTAMVGTNPDMGFDYTKNYTVPPNYFARPNVLFPIYGIDITRTAIPQESVFGVIAADGKSVRCYARALLFKLEEGKTSFEDTIGGAKVSLSFDKKTGILTAKDANGNQLLVVMTMWATWRGGYPKTEVWQEETLLENARKVYKSLGLTLSSPASTPKDAPAQPEP